MRDFLSFLVGGSAIAGLGYVGNRLWHDYQERLNTPNTVFIVNPGSLMTLRLELKRTAKHAVQIGTITLLNTEGESAVRRFDPNLNAYVEAPPYIVFRVDRTAEQLTDLVGILSNNEPLQQSFTAEVNAFGGLEVFEPINEQTGQN